uniref:Alpha-2-HS-glycoprotein 2 n=1 Tax=Astyanax mexicanus TaxID=7994 RepID=A0A3B1JMT7_ASTMX
MKLQATSAVLSLLLVGSWAQALLPNITLPTCDSPEAQAATQVALDYINAQNTHGYKYALNQIEDIKIITRPDGAQTYMLELEFLETKCHVLDPTPAAQCPVRTIAETAVEADCDVALSKTAGVLSVVAFKCKTETETPDSDLGPCVGCSSLIPLNDTDAALLVQASLDIFNKNNTFNSVFALFEVGRLSSQVVSGGLKLSAEYAIIETNCTSTDDKGCVPLNHTVARHGFCFSEGIGLATSVDCQIYLTMEQIVDPASNITAPPAPPQVLLHAHTAGPGLSPAIHALKHHKLTALHDPSASGLLSAESAESVEAPVVVVPVAPVVPEVPAVVVDVPADVSADVPAGTAPVVKREVAAEAATPAAEEKAAEPLLAAGVPLVPRCPGKIIHFST